MNRSALQVTIEIEKMNIILADRLPLIDLIKKTFRSKFTWEMVTQERKTSKITEDPDTICFMKYLLHNRVKAKVVEEHQYEEIASFRKVQHFNAGLAKKVNVCQSVRLNERRQAERLRVEKEVL